jgi:hypothetical protein
LVWQYKHSTIKAILNLAAGVDVVAVVCGPSLPSFSIPGGVCQGNKKRKCGSKKAIQGRNESPGGMGFIALQDTHPTLQKNTVLAKHCK